MFDRRPPARPCAAEELANLLRSGALGVRLIDAARHGAASASGESISRRIGGGAPDADGVLVQLVRRTIA